MSVVINYRVAGDVSVISASGRITLGEGVSSLREALLVLMREGRTKILLDLANISYIDSSGLGMLVSSFASVTNRGGQLKLANLSNRVKDLLLITKLLTVFEVYSDETAAISSFVESSAEAKASAGKA